LENTRVAFGNPNSREVQTHALHPHQPQGAGCRGQAAGQTVRRAGGEIKPDNDEANDRFDAMSDGKCTTVLKLWRCEQTGTIRAAEAARGAMIRPEWELGQKRYPVVWMPWEYVQNCCHGQAAVTGLIPNQVFVNKMFAMTMISLMTTAYPKVVYDQTRVAKWDSRVGAAIGVNGGDVGTVARTIDPAAISPQVSQFIQLAITLTKEFMGATDAALGAVRPDNTSAILALQKASSVPMELVKQNLFQCIEDLGCIWLDLMRAYYGVRYVETGGPEQKEGENAQGAAHLAFDFSRLGELPLSLKLDVGGSAYWSEIAQMNTLDNLLAHKQIDLLDYLERIPSGYISNQQELIAAVRKRKEQEAGQDAGGIQAPQAGAVAPSAASGPNARSSWPGTLEHAAVEQVRQAMGTRTVNQQAQIRQTSRFG
jgi:hypothetical protein